jgi:hypothetical protein
MAKKNIPLFHCVVHKKNEMPAPDRGFISRSGAGLFFEKRIIAGSYS